MKPRCCFLLLLYFGLTSSPGVCAKNDHIIKRGTHPFMAFIYYSDSSVVDVFGQRFIRSAVLIRSDWLVTTAIGPSLTDPPNGFLKKTLMARAGAITIDPKFTLNEDEDEQEREIVQIVRPYNHSATQWWTTDISLMKTLIPFNLTTAVGIKPLNIKGNEGIDTKTCNILVYVKKYSNGNSNDTEDKILTMLYVDMLPPSISNCGSHFTANTMACATESEENRDAMYDPDFCQGNSGGPLICDNEVFGLQTYIGNDCKQPHLYQLLYAWDNFITCGIENKCLEENCGAICDVIYKDPPEAELKVTPPVTHDTARDLVDFLNIPATSLSDVPVSEETSEDSSVTVTSPTVTSVSVTNVEIFATSNLLKTEETNISSVSELTSTTEIELFTTPNTTISSNDSSSIIVDTTLAVESTETLKVENIWTQETHTKQTWPKVRENSSSESDNETTNTSSVVESSNEPKLKVWPKGKTLHENFVKDDSEKRKPNVEAQQHAPVSQKQHKNSTSDRNMCLFQTVFFGFIVLLCM